MKIRLQLKDPDGIADSVFEAMQTAVINLQGQMNAREFEGLLEQRIEDAHEQLEPWVEFQEYLTVEIDTETGATSVVKVGR